MSYSPSAPAYTFSEDGVPDTVPSTPEMMIWDETDNVPDREWTKLGEDFTNAGYREGITAGKESALQKGFDDGFARIGAPLGREIGMLRGAANAAIWLTSKWASSTGADPAVYMPREREVRTILCELAGIGLEDLAPRDVQAEEHAEEHRRGEIGTTLGEVQISAEANAHADGVNSLGSVQEQIALVTDEPLVVKPAVEKLNQLRIRLSKVLRELGLDITLG